MILGFMQRFPWKADKQPVPTFFREKILAGVVYEQGRPIEIAKAALGFKGKIHTIREDKHDRWKPGMSIQMVYRGPKYSILDHFNKGIPELERCVSLQRIEIKWVAVYPDKPVKKLHTFVDDRLLTVDETHALAVNDGFNDLLDFCKWFDKDFTGKIIHFTDFKYK